MLKKTSLNVRRALVAVSSAGAVAGASGSASMAHIALALRRRQSPASRRERSIFCLVSLFPMLCSFFLHVSFRWGGWDRKAVADLRGYFQILPHPTLWTINPTP